MGGVAIGRPTGRQGVGRARPEAALGILLAATLFPACQTAGLPAMSVEEAKQITATFGGTFVPPPRTINDITAILDQQKLADPEAAAKARAKADQPPPDTTGAATLANFYYERGLAAREIGRGRQEVEDLKKAAEFAARGAEASEHEILFELGVAEVYTGSYSRAIEYVRQAVPKVPYNRRGAAIKMHGVLALWSAYLGDLDAAQLETMRTAALVAESAHWRNLQPEWIAFWNSHAAITQGTVLAYKGKFEEAEPLFRRSITALEQHPVSSRHTFMDTQLLRLSILLIRQGRLLEAENAARAALTGALRKTGRNSPHTGNVLRGLAYVIFEQGRFAEAEALARASIDIFEKAGAAPESLLLAYARSLLGAALVSQRRWDEALTVYETMRQGMVGDEQSFQKVLAGNRGWAMALLNTGRPAQALDMLQIAFDRDRRMLGEEHPITAETRGMLAMALAATGDRARALRECREATRILLGRSLEFEDENLIQTARERRVTMILTACIRLLGNAQGTSLAREAGVDAVAEAFRLAEGARGRSVQRALNASAVRGAAKTPALADLVRKEQDAKNQVAALYGLLANALSEPTERQTPTVIAALQTQIQDLQRVRQRLVEQIERDFPAYAQLVNPPPATVDQARASLRPGEALISTYVAPDRTFVWAIPHSGPAAFTAAPLGEKALEAAVATLRKSLDPSAKTLGGVPAFDVATAYRIYHALLEPVAGGWQQAESLLIVPHGPLGQLPFALLPTKATTLGPEAGALFANYRAVPWLVRTHAVTVLPSVASLGTLRALPPGDPNRRPFVGFGDPLFSVEQARRAPATEPAPVLVAALGTRGMPIALRAAPQTQMLDSSQLAMLPRLPDTAEEIRTIARTMNADLTRDVFLGERANEHVVKTTDLSRYRVLAFATHGLVPGDLDGLTQPGLALSAPEVAKVEGDGVLTMEEILGLRLNADWVVLSACNTASAQGAGAEAVSGLGRAFFYAGSRALLVSNWPVETTSARALTTELFRRQQADPALSRARALQETMNAMIDGPGFIDPRTNTVVFSFAHPIFWAPFSLVGDGGGAGK